MQDLKLLLEHRTLHATLQDGALISFNEPTKKDIFFQLAATRKLTKSELQSLDAEFVQQSFTGISPETSLYNPKFTPTEAQLEDVDFMLELDICRQFFRVLAAKLLQPEKPVTLTNTSWSIGDEGLRNLGYDFKLKINSHFRLENCLALCEQGDWFKVLNDMFVISINDSDYRVLTVIEQQHGELPGCIYQQMVQVVTDFLQRFGYQQRIY